MLAILRALWSSSATVRTVNVPELTPPVHQERVLYGLVHRQVGHGQTALLIAIHGIYAINVPPTGARLRPGRLQHHLEVGIDHGLGQPKVVIPYEVVVNVCVDKIARILLVLYARSRHVAHDRRAVNGPSHIRRVHARHGSHLRVLHGDEVGQRLRRQTQSTGG